MAKLISRFIAEIGLKTLYNSDRDTKLLVLQRFVRLFAYGGSTLVLVLYLRALDIPESRIGIFMSLTLVGDIGISFILTLFADALGRKRVLAVGSALMCASGVLFGVFGNYWILLAAAVFGVISPSGNEIGPFRAVEESTLAHLTASAVRSDIFAWYQLIGLFGGACGTITGGFVVNRLQTLDAWDDVRSYRAVFFIYAVLGMVKFVLACALSSKVEAEKPEPSRNDEEITESLLSGDHPNMVKAKAVAAKVKPSLIPSISKESKIVVTRLCLLFALDSFASGMVPTSWVTYFFQDKFNLNLDKLGTLFFTAGIIASLSTLVAASIARRIGLVETMVFTHLPSAISLALIPVPSSLPFAMLFLLTRACTQSMDSAPRQAFLAAVVAPEERTVIMGFVNSIKTACQSLGPITTGFLAQERKFWIAFILAGLMKASYDLGMLAVFKGHKTHEDRAAERLNEDQWAKVRADGEFEMTSQDGRTSPKQAEESRSKA